MILSILKIKNTAALVKGRGCRQLELVTTGFCAQKPTTLTCCCVSRCKIRLLKITLIKKILELEAQFRALRKASVHELFGC